MRKFQKIALATMLVLVVAQSMQAKPRGRRRNRRASVNYGTTQSYNASHYQTRTQPGYQPSNDTPVRSANSQQYSVQPSPSQPYSSSPSSSLTLPVPKALALAEERTLDAGDLLPSVLPQGSQNKVAVASYESPIGSATPTITRTPANVLASYSVVQPQLYSQGTLQTSEIVPTQGYAANNTATYGGAMAEVNAIRARQGLHPFIEDPSLSSVAYRKASIQANRGRMGHPGGSMGGARYEGVGMGGQFTSCYLYSTAGQYAGAATVRGQNGRRYHCLLVK